MKRQAIIGLLALSIHAVSCGPAGPFPLPPPQERGDPVLLPDDPRRAFDFWLGEWDVTNKHADRRGNWEDSGEAVARIQSVADGGALLEQWNGSLGGNPLIGFSLRAYDPATDLWSVWLNWHGGKPGGFSEMHGYRNGERMELFPPGNKRELRYSFAEARTESCQWEQGVSDDGQTWITNWVMHFSRRGRPPALDAANAPIVRPPGPGGGFPQSRALDFLLGVWEGSHVAVGEDGVRRESSVRARVTSMIEGFGLLLFLDAPEGDKSMAALGWDRAADGWVALRVDNAGGGIERMTVEFEVRGVRFASQRSGLRERWFCPRQDACSWRRETTADGGATWVTTMAADLQRSASTSAWIDIRNARAPFDRVLTGGQPTEDQLAWAARNGYRTVVNLRAPGEEGEITDEAAQVEALGMKYVSIPMSSDDDLNAENAAKLARALGQEGALPIVVHCASGNRVGALFGLKAFLQDGLDAEAALDVARQAGITRMEPALRQRLQ